MSQLPTQPSGTPGSSNPAESKRIVAGILGILLGSLGVHRFFLGDTKGGIFRILLSCTMVGSVIGLIEGIIYLTKTDEQFNQEYIVNKKEWF